MEVPLVISETTFRSGGETLFRRTVAPEQGAWARLELCHGYGEHSGRHLHALRWLAERGVECHALDLRGQGRSTGRRGYVHRWEEYVDDFEAFLGEVDRAGQGETRLPTFLLGHSHGALVVLASVLRGVREVEEVRGLILTAPYLRSCMEVPAWKKSLARLLNPLAPRFALAAGLREEWMSSDQEMIRDSMEDMLNVRRATVRWYVTAHEMQVSLRARAAEIQLPLLAMAGAADPISDPAAVRQFVEAAGSADKTFYLYPELLHELFREKCREELFSTVLQWMRPRSALSPEDNASIAPPREPRGISTRPIT